MSLHGAPSRLVDTAGRLHRAELRPRELLEVARILVVAVRVDRSLRREPLTATARRARVRLEPVDDVEAADALPFPQWARRRAELTAAVLRRGPVSDTCLRRSLVTGHRLAALRPVLVIGIRPAGERIEAHAWLRIAGRSLDPTAGDFVTFDQRSDDDDRVTAAGSGET